MKSVFIFPVDLMVYREPITALMGVYVVFMQP